MQLTIEKLVYGGDGLARTERGVVFVPRTAAGDVIEAEVFESKKDYAIARLIKVLEPSPDRQEPYCPNYATEGCCHWQHIRYEKQLDYKEAVLRESLRRVGQLEWNSEIHRISGPDRNYRLRATFHVKDGRLVITAQGGRIHAGKVKLGDGKKVAPGDLLTAGSIKPGLLLGS